VLYIRSRFAVRNAVGVGGAGIIIEISGSVRRDERLVLDEHREPSLVRGDEFDVDEDDEVDFVDWEDESDVGSGFDMRTRSGEDESGGLNAYTGRERVRDGDDGEGVCVEYKDNMEGVYGDEGIGSTGEFGCRNRATRSNGVGRALRGLEIVERGSGSEGCVGVSWMIFSEGRETDRGRGGRTLYLSDRCD